MKIALECPTKALEMVQPFADFDFVLANKVLKDPKYAEFYKNSNRPRILDNGVNEDGTPVTIDDLKKALEVIVDNNSTFIVALDWVGKKNETLQGYLDTINAFDPARVVPVVQGANAEEALMCADFYLRAGKAPLICIPYRVAGSIKETHPDVMALRRANVVARMPNIPIHLLGFNSLGEFRWYNNMHNIVSIDTGIPVMLGLQGKDILDPIQDKTKVTYAEMEKTEITKDNLYAIVRNIALFRVAIATM